MFPHAWEAVFIRGYQTDRYTYTCAYSHTLIHTHTHTCTLTDTHTHARTLTHSRKQNFHTETLTLCLAEAGSGDDDGLLGNAGATKHLLDQRRAEPGELIPGQTWAVQVMDPQQLRGTEAALRTHRGRLGQFRLLQNHLASYMVTLMNKMMGKVLWTNCIWTHVLYVSLLLCITLMYGNHFYILRHFYVGISRKHQIAASKEKTISE